jgi:hypothetical protein
MMRPHPVDTFSLVAGLLAVLVGGAGVAGTLDAGTLAQGWLITGLVLVAGIGLLASTWRLRQRASRDEAERESRGR